MGSLFKSRQSLQYYSPNTVTRALKPSRERSEFNDGEKKLTERKEDTDLLASDGKRDNADAKPSEGNMDTSMGPSGIAVAGGSMT